MAGRTLELDEVIAGVDPMAKGIAEKYLSWEAHRKPWLNEKRELRNYVFQTDTRKTTNANLPWKNSTTTPKLCQIRDNLHANYMAALFPHDDWLNWQAEDRESAEGQKRQMIESYMKNKTRVSHFRATISKMVYDYIDFGNVFGTVEYVNETRTDDNEEEIPGYVGPKAVRISPYDIVFNPTADSFGDTPKIIRAVKTLGELEADIDDHPEDGWKKEIFDLVVQNREKLQSISPADMNKSDAYIIDGFGSVHHYYESGFVELLEFRGDLYNEHTKEFLKDHIITVVDRLHIVRLQQNPSWRPAGSIRHVGWRLRPDNLYAMGPLDNLVGLQYRIDHLENLKADVFDQIAHPITKVKGFVEDWTYQPGERVYLGDDGDIEHLRPDVTALNADTQIEQLKNTMEDMAGAPKTAMGIRTPGEKTLGEVQLLDNASGRIFQNKISFFEDLFLEELLNDMLEISRRNINEKDIVRTIDDKTGTALFNEITPQDLSGVGRIYPQGARHFAQKATMMQNLLGLASSPLGADPAVSVHISGKKMARLIEEALDLERFGLVKDNVRLEEQHETQQTANFAQRDLQETEALTNELATGISDAEAQEQAAAGSMDGAPPF
jgi:hypothetical protein|tara:strand:- start:5075 stop:6901 length:1827 start_codon:yes stop_codon:yes gene_type:complete